MKMIKDIKKKKYYFFIFIIFNLIVFSHKEISRAITVKDRATKVDSSFIKIDQNLKNADEYLSEYNSKKARLNKEKKDFFVNLEEYRAISLMEEFFSMNNFM